MNRAITSWRDLGAWWPEVDTAAVIGFGSGRHIQCCDGNFTGALLSERPRRLANNREGLNLFAVMIAKYQRGPNLCFRGLGRRHNWPLLGAQARDFVVPPVDLGLLGVDNVRTGVVSPRVSKSRIGLCRVRVKPAQPKSLRYDHRLYLIVFRILP